MNASPILIAAALGTLFALPSRGDHPFGSKLGTVNFETGGRPDAREHVVRGVKLVHHMMYAEADREFAQAAAADPNCAMAHWGRAMTIIHPLWPDSPTEAERKQGAEHLRKGLACPVVTPRERDYFQTLLRYFAEDAAGDHIARLKVLDVAWSELAQRHPDDMDAVAFSALYHLAPARFVAKDKSHRMQIEAVGRLQTVFARIPDHPGAQHYKIHAFDFPLLADRALEVCDSYTSIAPEVPHALHMPSHIFTRRGIWDKSIDFNLRSAEAARKLGLNAGALNGHYAHALDYLAYAYLQRGQYHEAEAIRERVTALTGPYAPAQATTMAFAFAAIPARCALERQAWAKAAALPLDQPASFAWTPQYANCHSIVHFARAIGAARSGRLDTARAAIAELERIQLQLAGAKREVYWISQAEAQLLAARAWVLHRENRTGEAIVAMQRAVSLEATTDKEAVTPGETLPSGDLLGDLLLEAGKPADALAAFEAVLTASPNRLNTLYGAGYAAEKSGNAAKAREKYQQLVTIAAASDAGIARVEHARSFLAAAGGTR